MAVLPTEADVPAFPEGLPRRQGIGSWQPNDLAQGAQSIARGGEALAGAIAGVAGEQNRVAIQTQTANAESQWAVDRVNLTNQLAKETDPDAAVGYADKFTDAFNAARGSFTDPGVGASWATSHAPQLAESAGTAGKQTWGLQRGQALGDFDQNSDTLISSALQAPDEDHRTQIIGAYQSSLQSMVGKGYLTPEQAAEKIAQFSHTYASSNIEQVIADANRTGDTSKLVQLRDSLRSSMGLSQVAPSGVQPGAIVPNGTQGVPIGSFQTAVGRTLGFEGGRQVTDVNGAQVKWGINAAANPGVNISGLDSSSASAIYKTKYWDTINGDQLNAQNPALAHVAFDTSVIAGPGEANALLAKSGGDPMQFMALRDQYLQGLVARDPGKYGRFAQTWASRDAQLKSDVAAGNVVAAPAGGGASGSGAPAPAGGAPPAPGSVMGVGDSLAAGVADAAGQDNSMNKFALQGLPPTGKNSVQGKIDALDPGSLNGKTVVLSSGASNAPGMDPGVYLPNQIKGLKAKGAANVVVLGTGTRADIAPLSDRLKAAAEANGATFMPLDKGMVTGDGVHLTGAGYKGVVQQVQGMPLGGGAATGSAAAGGGGPQLPVAAGFRGLPPPDNPAMRNMPAPGAPSIAAATAPAQPVQPAPDASGVGASVTSVDAGGGATLTTEAPGLPHAAPPHEQWPDGAQSVVQNGDGSLSYQMKDGTSQAVPGSRATGAVWSPTPRGSGHIIDFMHPQQKAEMALRVESEINTIERRNGAASDQAQKAATSYMAGATKDMISGRPIVDNGPGSEYDKLRQQFATSPDPVVRYNFAVMDAIHRNLTDYQGMTPAQVGADVDKMQSDYTRSMASNPDSPFNPVKREVLTAAQGYLKTYQEEAFKDPLARASKAGILPNGITPIDPNSQNPTQDWQQRVADGNLAADKLGVPPRYITSTERPMLRSIARGGGQPMIDMARSIVAGAGAQSGEVLKEIGGDAPGLAWVGRTAAMGGDQDAMRQYVDYLRARSDKGGGKDIPVVNDGILRKAGATPTPADALAAMPPDINGQINDAAHVLLSERARQNGDDPRGDATTIKQTDVDRAYNLAAGGWYGADGTQYGGFADRASGHGWLTDKPFFGGASQKLLVPNDMNAAKFPAVVDALTDSMLARSGNPPMGRNGQPITANQIQNGALAAVPDTDDIFRGRYGVYVDGARDAAHLVRGADGKPWALDFQNPALRDALGKAIPGAFTENPHLKTFTQPYRDVPGVIADQSEDSNG